MATNFLEPNSKLALNSSKYVIFSNGFSVSQRHIFDFPMNLRSTRRMGVLSIQTVKSGTVNTSLEKGSGPDSGVLIAKDLEFKPSFDEYLKAMESSQNAKSGNNKSVSFRKDKVKEDKGVSDHRPNSKGHGVNVKLGNGVVLKERSSKGARKSRVKLSKMVKDESDGYGSGGNEAVAVKINQRADWVDRSLVETERKNWRDNRQNVYRAVDEILEEGKNSFESKSRVLEGPRKQSLRIKDVGGNDISIRRNNIGLDGIDDCDDLEVERAALKVSSEGVIGKQGTSQREMEERIQKLAKSLNGTDINIPEWLFSKMIRSAHIKYTDHSIVRVIQILGNLGNWRRVLQVLEWLQKRERFKSHRLRYIYTSALDALRKARRPMEALNVFHAMLQQMSSYPDLVAYHSIAVTLGQGGLLKELFDVIDTMRNPPKKKFKVGVLTKWDPRLEPNVIVYNAVLNACVQQKQWEGAFWVLQQLKQKGQKPAPTTYGLVMEVMFACGKYDLVHEIFRKMQKSSIPNALTYKVLVNTFWKEGKTDEAVSAIQDMERRGIVGSAALYYDLARCLCSDGRCKEALMQVDKICKVANKPLVVTYTGLMQACIEAGKIDDGAYVFNQMEQVCSPNVVTCNIMLKAYLERGVFEEAKVLFTKMLENSTHICRNSDYESKAIPDTYTFNTMLEACILHKRWDDFHHVYQRMLHHGYHFNAKRHVRLILEASRAGKGEPLETTWQYLAETNRIPPPALIAERFVVKLEKNDIAAALSCLSSNPLNHQQGFSKSFWLEFLKENAGRFQKDTLVRLMKDVSIVLSTSIAPDEVLENLMESCKQFYKLDSSTDYRNRIAQIARTIETEAPTATRSRVNYGT